MFLLQTNDIESMEIELGSSDKDTLTNKHITKASIQISDNILVDQYPDNIQKVTVEQEHHQTSKVDFDLSDKKTDFPLTTQNVGQKTIDRVGLADIDIEMTETELDSTKTEVVIFTEQLIKEFWDSTKMKLIHPRTGKCMNIQECINCGVISSEIVQVKQPNGNTVSLQKAINSGQVNIHTGQTVDLVEGKNVPLDIAFEAGLLTVNDNEPMERCDMYVELGPGIVELIVKGEIDLETRLFDRKMKRVLSIPKGIEINLFDTGLGKVKDTETGKWLSWDDAKQQKLVCSSDMQLETECSDCTKESASEGHILTKDSGLEKSHTVLEHPKSKILEWKRGAFSAEKPTTLSSKSKLEQAPVMLDEAIKQGLYSPVSNTFRIPTDNTKISFENALKQGFINKESLLRDPISRDILSLEEAIEKRVVDPESGKMLDTSGQPIPLNYAYNIGLIMRSQSPLKLSISEILDEGLYDEETGTFLDPDLNEEISFTQSLYSGLVDPELIRVRDSSTGEILKLETAIKQDLINVETGTFIDKPEGKTIQIPDALEKGLIIDTTNQPKMSLQSAFEENMIDVDSCLFLDPAGGPKQTLKDAIESCLLDKDSVLVRDPKSLTILTLESAIAEDIIHSQTGKYNLGPSDLSFGEAFEKGLIVCNSAHGVIPCSLIEAIRFNLYDQVTRTFTDPRSGQCLTLEEAINSGLIDPNNTAIKDTQTGRFLSLSNAAYLGVINFKTADVLDLKEDGVLELTEAKEKGILRRSASDDCLSLVTAITKGTSDGEGRFFDSLSGKSLILSDAILAKVIDPIPTLVKDTKRNIFLPLTEALESGIIDESKGHVFDIVNCKALTYADAVETGLIIEIPSTGLTLAEAVSDGLFDEETGLLLDLRTGKKVTLEESLEQKLVDSLKLQVVVPGCGLLSLKDAFETGVIDSKSGCYKENDNEISLTEAVDKDLIVKLGRRRQNKTVSDSDLKNLEALVVNKDVLVKDPTRKSFLSLDHALEAGVLDLHTETYCDIQHDVILPLQEAIKLGLVVNARYPNMGLVSLVRNDMFDHVNCTFFDPRTGNKISLEEGVKLGLIDPFQTRVKNLETGTYVSLHQALKTGIISGKTGTVFEKHQMKSFPLDYCVHENIVIDFSKSSFTVDEGIHYGLMTHDGLMVEDLESGEFITFKDAVERGTIKIENAVLACPAEGLYMTLAEGIEDCTVDETSAMVNLPSGRRLSLSQAVAQHMIIEKDSTLFSAAYHEADESENHEADKSENESIDEEASKANGRKRSIELDLPLMDKKLKREANSPILSPVLDMFQTEMVSSWVDTASFGRSDSVSSPIRFDEALKFGFLDIENDEFRDNITSEIMPIEYAIETGKLSVKDVLFFDEKTNFSIPLKEAIKCKLIISKHDSDTSKNVGLTFKEALNESLLMLQVRKVNFNDDKYSVKSDTFSESVTESKTLDWFSNSKALSSSLDSLIQKVQKDQSGFRIGTLYEALQKNLIDEKAGMIQDSFTQRNLTLKEALSSGLINPGASEIFDPRTEENLTLEDAINLNIIDPQSGQFKHPATGEMLSLRHAYEKGFISKSKDSVESKSSVEIYVEEILANDAANGKNKLQEAFASGVLNKSKTQVIDPDTVQPITLRRAGSLGMIDSKTGEFKNPQTGEHISLVEAVQKGFILSPKGLSLYSAVNQGLYSDVSGKFTDPISGKECTLNEMVEMDIIADGCMEIRDVLQNGELIRLRDALKRGVIDSTHGRYINLVDDNKCNFNEAIALGLIISNIPREGLRESSRRVTAMGGHPGKPAWISGVESNKVANGHSLNQLEKGKTHPVTKESTSLSSIETESSGYETNKSQPQHSQEEAPAFIIDFEKYKLKPNILEDIPCTNLDPGQYKQLENLEHAADDELKTPTKVTLVEEVGLTEKGPVDEHINEQQAPDFDTLHHLQNGEMTPTGVVNNEKITPNLDLDFLVKPNLQDNDQTPDTIVFDLSQSFSDMSSSLISNKSLMLSMSKPDGPLADLLKTDTNDSVSSPRSPKSPVHLHDNYRFPGESQRQMLSPVKSKVFTFQTGPPLSLSEERKVFGYFYKHLLTWNFVVWFVVLSCNCGPTEC